MKRITTIILFILFPNSASPCFADNAHFESLLNSPNLHAAYSLQSQAEINKYTHGKGKLGAQPGGNNPNVQYDEVMQAAKVTIPAGRSGLPGAWQVRLPFGLIDKTTGDREVSVQWEVRYSSDWLTVLADGLKIQKTFQIARAGSPGAEQRYEWQMRFNKTWADTVALPTIRLGNPPGPSPIEVQGRGFDPLHTNEGAYLNWQPGGDTIAPNNQPYKLADHLSGTPPENNAFTVRPDKWIRFTASITFDAEGKQRFRYWAADQDTPPVLVTADPSDSSKGFISDYEDALSGANEFWLEFNSSQYNTTNPDLRAWVRNVVVFRNSTVPLGVFGPADRTAPKAPMNLRLKNFSGN